MTNGFEVGYAHNLFTKSGMADTLIYAQKLEIAYAELRARNAELEQRLKEMTDERDEQARLNGMGSEREAALMGKVAELERKLAASTERCEYLLEQNRIVNEKALRAEQRIAESRGQEVIAWVRQHPDGALTDEFLSDDSIEPVRKSSGAWKPLHRIPIVPPDVDEAVKSEREACANISPNYLGISATAAPHIVWQKYRDAIRARGNK